jgi:hypothetical protein
MGHVVTVVEVLSPSNKQAGAMYDRAGYDLRIDYGIAPPPPPLSADDAAWVAEQVGAA